jgi:hypothetical protein
VPALLARFIPHIAAALAIVGAVWWINDAGYERAQADQAALEKRLTARIDATVADIDRVTADRLGGIDAADRTIIQPLLTREIAGAPRYSDPDCALTPGVFDALNRAIALSATVGANGQPVPAAASAD